jgi:putative nucleotidyltransferase with HDIG domain
MSEIKIPSREQALKYLLEAYESNPRHYPWHHHCINAAKLASAIAKVAKLDVEYAFIVGLMHDIGRRYVCTNHTFEGERRAHEILGYEFMKQEGYPEIARICLTHTLQNPDVTCKNTQVVFFNNDKDLAFVAEFLRHHKIDIYDKLIQMVDMIARENLWKTIENSMQNVINFYGSSLGQEIKVNNLLQMKVEFDELCGQDIYQIAEQVIITDWSNFDIMSLK